MPDGEALVLGLVIGPSQDGTAKALQRQAEVLLIPGRERGVVVSALEEDAAD